jgi:glycosyltransferase involved in cell wall biosynthesis
MRILVLAPQPFFQPRGTPIAVRMVVETLAAAGHQVDLLTFHEGEDVPLSSGQLHRIPAPPGVRNIRPGFSAKKLLCDGAMLFSAISLVRRNRYDVLHAVEEAVYIARILRAMFGTPYVYDMDSSLAQQLEERMPGLRPLRRLLTQIEGRAIRSSAGVIAVCGTLETLARRNAPAVRVLRLEDASLVGEEHAAALSLGPDPDLDLPRPIALYVGNLEPYQGVDLLLDTYRLFVRRGGWGSLAVIGGTADHVEHYRRRAADMGLEGVHFLGPRPVDRLGFYLSQADVLVSPRIKGINTPMKIYSYMHSGRPILATNLETHTQVMSDLTACLVDPTPEAMADGLGRLTRDRAWASELAARAADHAGREFTKAAFQVKLTQFYDACADQLPAHSDADRLSIE